MCGNRDVKSGMWAEELAGPPQPDHRALRRRRRESGQHGDVAQGDGRPAVGEQVVAQVPRSYPVSYEISCASDSS